MKELLRERVRRLIKKRAEVEARALDELNRIDQQIAPLETLVKDWDTLSVDQALNAVTRAGLTIKVDQ